MSESTDPLTGDEITRGVFDEPFFKSKGSHSPGRIRIWDTLHFGWWPTPVVGVWVRGYIAPEPQSLKARVLSYFGMDAPTEFWHFQRR